MAQAPQQNFNVGLNKMASMLPSMPDEKLAELARSPQFGALALTEISKRDRIKTMQEAQQGTPGGTIADAMIAQMMQQKMRDRLMAEEAMGLNNLVAQAEQGNIQFGEAQPEMPAEMMAEPVMAAGGGMIAFEKGGSIKQTQDGKRYFDDEEVGRVYEDGSVGYAGPAALIPAAAAAGRAVIGYAPRFGRGIADLYRGIRGRPSAAQFGPVRPTAGRLETLSGLSALGSLPFMFGDEEGPEGPPVSDTYREEFEGGSAKGILADEAKRVADLAEAAKGAKNEKKAAQGIADLLGGNTTASDILKERRRLEQEAGLGEYGAGVKEKQAKRRAETEEKFDKETIVQALLGAAEGAGGGGKRLTGLGALAAAASGGGKGALAAMKEERAALKEIDDAQEKMAMAEDLYRRGDIASAQKMAAEAQQQQQANALKLRQLEIYERAATAKTAGKFTLPQTVLTEFAKQRADIETQFSGGQIDEAEYQRRLNILELQKREILSLALLGGAQRIERETEG